MTLASLTTILPPPAQPVETGSRDEWQAVEEDLGCVLPADYKEFIATYGTGDIDDFLQVTTPLPAPSR